MSQKIQNKQLIISSDFNINSQKLVNVSTPTDTLDAANKYYVDLAVNEWAQITGEPTGFPQDAWTESDLTITGGNTVSLQPTGTTFFYYISGQRYDSSGVTLQISDVEGMHYFYMDTNGNLQQQLFFSDYLIFDVAYVAGLYWDATNNSVIQIGDERHGYIMDPVTHSYLHQVFGTEYISGLAVSLVNPVDGTGDVGGDAQILIEDGRIRDEDIVWTISDDNPQNLRPILNIPVYYREGTSNWRKQSESLFPVISGGARLAYNSLAGSVWGQTTVGQSDVVNTHIFATNDIYNPIIAIQGQAEYTSIAIARNGANDEINNLVTGGMAFQEFTPIATIIFQTSTAYSNAVNARIRSTDEGADFIDWRGTKISPGVAPSSHSSLSDLNVDSHLQYALLQGRTGDILKIDKISGFTGGYVSFDGNKITDILTPTADTDAANKKYVDDTVDSLTYSTDINLTAISGTGQYLATNTTVSSIPITNIKVNINSLEVNVGNGTKIADCYFTDDSGATAKTFTTMALGDQLYWNGDVAKFQLEVTDEIDFVYLTR